jgi:hypothetical protein
LKKTFEIDMFFSGTHIALLRQYRKEEP